VRLHNRSPVLPEKIGGEGAEQTRCGEAQQRGWERKSPSHWSIPFSDSVVIPHSRNGSQSLGTLRVYFGRRDTGSATEVRPVLFRWPVFLFSCAGARPCAPRRPAHL
jgi:hypothetical protein